MSSLRTTLLSILALISILNLTAQDISIEVFVYDHHTYAPLDSALISILHEGMVIDYSYSGPDGQTQLNITPTGVEEMKSGLPNTFIVSENYLNPFRDETQVNFSIPGLQTVRADIYNILGQRLMSEELTLSSGYYTMNLSLPHLSTGIYFLRFRGLEQQTIKLMKVGGDVIYDGGILSTGSIKITANNGVGLPLHKLYKKNGEFTIQVERDRYESWYVTKNIESDTEIDVPLVLLAVHLLSDIDGNVYQTVRIGNQVWMAENLRTTRYRNDDKIPTGLDSKAWQNTTDGAYAIYPHSEVIGISSNDEMLTAYGALYNWYAVDDPRGLCPEGWRVPSDDELDTLVNYLGGSNVAGGKMRSTRTEPDPHPRWSSPNIGANNQSGWSGLPGGWRESNGDFKFIVGYGNWWSHTEYSNIISWGVVYQQVVYL